MKEDGISAYLSSARSHKNRMPRLKLVMQTELDDTSLVARYEATDSTKVSSASTLFWKVEVWVVRHVQHLDPKL